MAVNVLSSKTIEVIQNKEYTQSVQQDHPRMSAYKKSWLSMEVEINMKTIYHQALDHRNDRGRKGRDPRSVRNIPVTTLSMSFAIDIRLS